MKSFLLKVKYFFKRNIYPITVSFCTVLILGIVTVSAYNSIKEGDKPLNNIETSKPADDVIIDTGSNVEDVNGEKQEVIKPTVSDDPIIFELPFEGAVISKIYADKTLLYDNTTKYWRTHQALDFACVEGTQVVSVYAGIIEKIENSTVEQDYRLTYGLWLLLNIFICIPFFYF